MNNMKLIVLSVLSAFLLLSCGGDPYHDVDQVVTLTASSNELTFDSKASSKEITITSDVKPTVSAPDSWISISEGSYSDNTLKINVSVTENTGIQDRTSAIRVIGNKQSLMIPVTQAVAQVGLSVDKSELSFKCYGGEDTIIVTSSTQPTVTCDAKWCTVTTGRISDSRETTVTVSVAGNRTKTPYKGFLTISCGNETRTVSISRDELNVSQTVATAITPQLVYDAMAPGWNLGNQMDAYSNGVASETVWGNKKCTQATMDALKAAGFKSVRICVTWLGHIGPAPAYKVDENWMNRVEEIVGYAEKAGLVAIVNTHHDECNNDGHWLDVLGASTSPVTNDAIKGELFNLWCQIALRFRDKGEWLIFEPFNELQDGGWGWSNTFRNNPKPQYDVINEWNQVFVDAVRCTGGKNATRWLGIPGYAASSAFTIPGLVLPTDYTAGSNRLIVAFHDYDPYNYTLANPLVRQWGHTADPDKRCSNQDEKNVTDTFDQFEAAYIDRGIPAYIGEFGCSRHSAEDLPYQEYYLEYFVKAAADHCLPMLLWDNGATGSGSECHGYINHATGAYPDETARKHIELIVKAATDRSSDYTLESIWDRAPSVD